MNEPIVTLYRISAASPDRVRLLVADVVGMPCWAFGGAALWDIDPALEKQNLRTIAHVSDIAALDLRGDFGHAFGERAEVRWRRHPRGYDTLVLAENLAQPEGTEALNAGRLTVRHLPPNVAILLEGLHRGQQLRFREYVAENGAVLFVRYTRLD